MCLESVSQNSEYEEIWASWWSQQFLSGFQIFELESM